MTYLYTSTKFHHWDVTETANWYPFICQVGRPRLDGFAIIEESCPDYSQKTTVDTENHPCVDYIDVPRDFFILCDIDVLSMLLNPKVLQLTNGSNGFV